jgi:hypothetical protein
MSASQSLSLPNRIRFIEQPLEELFPSSTQNIALILVVAISGCIGAALSFAGLALVVLMLIQGIGLFASLSLVAGLMLTLALILCAGMYHIWNFEMTPDCN